jgi:hypothetical protein
MNDHPSEARIHLIFDIFPSQAAVEIVNNSHEEQGEEDPVLYNRLASQSAG